MARTRIGRALRRRPLPAGRGQASGGKEPRPQYRRPMFPAGRGEKDNDQIGVKNTRYKIKKCMVQPKDVEVKHNSRGVRRMVVRRRAIYVTGRRRRHY